MRTHVDDGCMYYVIFKTGFEVLRSLRRVILRCCVLRVWWLDVCVLCLLRMVLKVADMYVPCKRDLDDAGTQCMPS